MTSLMITVPTGDDAACPASAKGNRANQGRAVLAIGLVALLAACGSQPRNMAHAPASGSSSWTWDRPASYDAPGPRSDPWGPYIKIASKRFDIPETWIRAVMRQESGGRTTATSPVGAMGLMQVMPGTYAELRQRYGLGDDPYHPFDSIMAGTAYIREMYELYGSPGYLAAYNAGPRRFEDYLWNGKGLPAETRNYVARIGPSIIGSHPNHRAAPEVYAAAEIPINVPAGPRRMDSSTMLALREQRDAVDPGVRVASLPPGPVIRMEPIPDGSTYQTASNAPVPPPGSVIRMDPIPDGSTYQTASAEPAPSSGGSLAETGGGLVNNGAILPAAYTTVSPAPIAAAPPPPAPEPARAPASALAARSESPLPTPPAYVPDAPSPRLASALARYTPPPEPAPSRPPSLLASASAAPAVTLSSRGDAPRHVLVAPVGMRPVEVASARPASRGFSLIGTAHADTYPSGPVRGAAPAASTGNWAIQVGAFASQNLARDAAGTARQKISVGGTRSQVQSVSSGRSTLYRARVIGLSQESAKSSCEKLRSHGACMVLSPDAQG